MKEEFIKMWNAYLLHCKMEEQQYFQDVVKQFGAFMYAPNKNNVPSFEGFMSWVILENAEIL